MIEEFICEEVRKRYDDGEPEGIMNWIVNELIGAVEKNLINLDTVEDVEESVVKVALTRYRKNRETIGNDIINQIEKAIFMDLLDQFWVRHLDQLVQLKEGIHLRAYAQTNPLVEYQREAAGMFQEILAELRHYYCMNVLHFDISNIAKG
ncbi:hypothetical protein G3M54_00015 [Bacillus megaterium NBRC 15308 = ATCC 14581]|nr:hypothetical protein [Priestia megaterium NBRC 15308 = ATCC 14581]